MPEIMPEERPFYWVCGKCRSRGIYRDDDFAVGDFAIACPICGNRYYGDLGGRSKGFAPAKVYYTPRPAPPPSGPGHFTSERTANILTGPWRSGARTAEKKEESMAKTGQCANCKREVTIYGAGLCSVCFRAGKGLKGEEKEAALIGIQKKIERGDIHAGGRKSPAVKSAPVGRKRPCANCGRSQTIVGGGCCWACYRAARGLEGEEKAAALAAVKAKIEGGGLRRGGGRKGPRTPAPKGTVKVDGDITPHRAPITVRIPVISLDFADRRDLKIYDALLDQARRLRRTPEQQILWMLQNVLEQEAGLLAEASTQSG